MPWVGRVVINIVLKSLPHTHNNVILWLMVKYRQKQSGLGLSSKDTQTKKMRTFQDVHWKAKCFQPGKGSGSEVQCLDWANAEERKSVQGQ